MLPSFAPPLPHLLLSPRALVFLSLTHSPIKLWQVLAEAAALDTAVIVGCGEPFDASTVSQSMLSFHKYGGGREAPKAVKKELAEKKMRAAQLKADQVRASGHGLSNAAASAAKLASIETNRESAAMMRHDYMNQLIARSAQQVYLHGWIEP